MERSFSWSIQPAGTSSARAVRVEITAMGPVGGELEDSGVEETRDEDIISSVTAKYTGIGSAGVGHKMGGCCTY
jgi:hypothetical protein